MNEYFFEQLKTILGSEFDDFKNAYDNKPRHKALRINTLKTSRNEFFELAGSVGTYGLKPNPLCDNGFYTTVKPSLDPLYHAGVYYMQEPSAQSAVSAFLPFVGERVLDLCAAPGGKTTQAAAAMNGNGVLFCNDTEFKRAKALAENVERLGVRNAVVTVGTASDYRRCGFDGYFDTLIVDAPCSGGGMMRYEQVPYSEEIVNGCAERQRAILDDAVELLCNGGYMLYSTCTFAPQENEENVRYLMSKGMRIVDIPLIEGQSRGIDLPDARRIYPHKFDGEGHFFCILKKECGTVSQLQPFKQKIKSIDFNGMTFEYGVRTGSLLFDAPQTDGLNILRFGVKVIEENKNANNGNKYKTQKMVEPNHALSHAMTSGELKRFGTVELTLSQAEQYIKGQQLEGVDTAETGFRVATVKGVALGFVKIAGNGAGTAVMKNLYPKRLRI